MVIIMNISEEKRTQICAALAKARQDIKRIQAAGVMDISEVERICRALQDVVQELRILIDQSMQNQPRGSGDSGSTGLFSCYAAFRPAAGAAK